MRKALYSFFAAIACLSVTSGASAQGSVGLIAHWPLSGNGGDSSGNGLHGTAVGTTPTAGRNGQPNSALFFSGTSYISIPYSPLMNTNHVTICATVNHVAFSTGSCQTNQILQRGTQFSAGSYGLMSFDNAYDVDCASRDTSKNVFAANISTNTNNATAPLFFYSPTIVTNTWYSVVVTYDSSIARVYVNGNLKSIVPIHQPLASSTEGLYIGMNYQGAGTAYPYGFTGVIDDIAVYNRVLTGSEILAYHHSTALDVPQLQPAAGMTIAPNPVAGALQLRLDKPVQGAQMSVLNSVGQVMAQQELNGSSLSLPVTDWPAGRYFVRLVSSGQVQHQTFTIL